MSLIFGYCAGCGGQVVDSCVHVPVVRKGGDGIIYVGPDMNLYHPACIPGPSPREAQNRGWFVAPGS